MNLRKNGFLLSITILSLSLITGCATLLMLPDELTEEHYTSISQIDSKQISTKMKVFPGGKAQAPKDGIAKSVRLLPIVYKYDTYNTLKENEEAYYVSIFNNSTGSWIKPFTENIQETLGAQLKKRGYDFVLLTNDDLKTLGAKDINSLIDGADRSKGNLTKGVALNAENRSTNLALVDRSKFGVLVTEEEQAVIYVELDVDWEPSSANRLNKDIVLNTALIIGYKLVACGSNGCSTIEIPFKDGVRVGLFMPNRNTINEDGLDKNYALIKKLHKAQLDKIIEESFAKLDQMSFFAK